MQRLNEVVDFYLKTETNFALMITGEWGVGKTYYFKNILSNQIAKTQICDGDKKKYIPILVSLFGLKSVEEVQTEIFLSLYPILKNKSVKLGANIGKTLLKGIMHLKSLGKYSEFVSEIQIDKSEWIKFDELVICFDDLERLSINFQMEELIGYINNLVENENVKILIIANENKIEAAKYSVLKEKVVGNSIEFIPDLNNSYDSLIAAKFCEFSTYKTFLIENKEFVLKVFTKKSSNLRILAFALTYFHIVFSEITIGLTSQDILKEREREILLVLFKFALVISIEYKEGRISFTKKESLDRSGVNDWSKFSIHNINLENNNLQKKEIEKTYREKIIEHYYTGDNYHYFQSVYVFLTGGSILKIGDLILELRRLYCIEENKVLPHYEVLNRLSDQSVFSLSDKEHTQLIQKMLNYSDLGSYEIQNYCIIFYLASSFGNPLGYNLDKLENRVIKGMNKGRSHYIYNQSLDSYLRIDSESENKERLYKIQKATLDLNIKIETENQARNSARLIEVCFNNFEIFAKEVLSKDNTHYYTPILQSFSVHKFYLLFLKGDNNHRWQIVRFLRSRYTDSHSSSLKPEIEFLEKLKHKVEKKMKTLPKSGVTSFIFNELDRLLQASISNLNEAK